MAIDPPEFRGNLTVLLQSLLTLLFWVPAWHLYSRVMDHIKATHPEGSVLVDIGLMLFGAALVFFLYSYA